MVSLKNEFRRWGKRLINGDNNYLLITKDDGSNTWLLVFNQCVESIKHVYIEADAYGDGNTFMYDYSWDIESPQKFGCTLIIKKGGELLCKDALGFRRICNGANAPLTAFRACFQTEDYEFNYEFKDSKARITTYNLHNYRDNDDDPSAKSDWLWE